MYEYEFVGVQFNENENWDTGMRRCEQTLNEYAAKGWRLNRFIFPSDEHRAARYYPNCYVLILEREKAE